ncbi:hypothetical protein [Williamsia maris]|uniref:hypothetical protein n=1 Tax=Williamsia maris TaxID=72806 RepID=UPI0020A48927|nr:hypothetical protein [Williamsia maris]
MHGDVPTEHRDPDRWQTTMIVAAASGVTGGRVLFIVGWFYGALAAQHTPTATDHGAEIVALGALFGSIGALATGATAGVTHRLSRVRTARSETFDMPDRSAAANITDDDTGLTTVTFAVCWLPYGGANSYQIFSTFGLTPAQFALELHHDLATQPAAQQPRLGAQVRDRLFHEVNRIAVMSWAPDTITQQHEKQVP